MFKKIAFMLLFVLPMGVFAQNLKFGHLQSYEIIQQMPEYTKAMTDLQNLQKQYQGEIQRAEEEFNKKYTEYMQQRDSLPENIAERRQKELQDLMERGQQFQQEVEQNMQKAQADMTAPIFKKMEDAIKAVGAEGGYIYIFDLSRTSIPYVNDAQSTDVSQQVRTKLGIK